MGDALAIKPDFQPHFQDLVALLAWQCEQPQQQAEPAPFSCAGAAPQVTLDDAVMRHHLSQMTSQDPEHALEQIRQCLAEADAGARRDHATTRGIVTNSTFHDWPDAIKSAALRSMCLRGADLQSLRTEGISLYGIDMRIGTVARVSEMEMTLPSFTCIQFDGAHLVNPYADRVNLLQARFNGATLEAARLTAVDASDVSFADAILSNGGLDGIFRAADFSRAQAADMCLQGNFSGANFSSASLTGISFAHLDTPDFTDACFDQTELSLSETYLADIRNADDLSYLGTRYGKQTLPRTLTSIDDRWEQTKLDVVKQVFEALSQTPRCDALMATSIEGLEGIFDMACSSTYVEREPFVASFINRHVLPAMATVPELIQDVLPERLDALLQHWSALVATAPWETLAPAQLALQRVLHASAGMPGAAELRQAWLGRPEVMALLTPEARDLLGDQGHVLVLGDAALVFDRAGFADEFMRIIGDDRDARAADAKEAWATVFAANTAGLVQRHDVPDVAQLAFRVLVEAPLSSVDPDACDVMFNHRNNEGHSLLRSIDRITGCDALKRGLMEALVASLGTPAFHKILDSNGSLILSLSDVLLDSPIHVAGPWVAAYNEEHLLPTLASYWSNHARSTEDAGERSTYPLACYLIDRLPAAAWEEASRLQFAVQQISAFTPDPALGGALRRAWQSRPEVAPVVRALGALEEELPDFSQVLVDGSRQRALAYEDSTFVALLMSDPAQWNSAYAFDADPQGNDYSNVPLENLESRLGPFPALLSAYHARASIIIQKAMISASAPPSFMPRFLESLTLKIQTGKLLGDKLQEELMQAFLPHLDDNSGRQLQMWGLFDTTRLNPVHVTKLIEAYRSGCNLVIAEDDTLDEVQRLAAGRPPLRTAESAALMLGLAGVYIAAGSSHRFGRELDSPQALRVYAMALLNEVEAIAPALLVGHTDTHGRPVVEDWKDRLQGSNKAFTCAKVLSDAVQHVISKLDAPLRKICDDVYPHAWR